MTDDKARFDLVGRVAARLAHGTSGVEPDSNSPSSPPDQIAAHRATDQPTSSDDTEPAGTAVVTGAGGAQVELDFASLHKEGFLTPYNQKSQIAEEFRILKRPLLRIAFDSRKANNGIGHVIMVTSSRPEDGKTFISTNLAFSMASERDLFVLLIDADIRRVGLSKKLGVEDRPGIMDVLINPALSISDVMIRTNVPNLAIIPAGRSNDTSTEMFASQRMTKLVRDISSRYKDRLIIFDAPPVLAASEPGVLAQHVGQILFVVRSGSTSKRSVAEALRLVDACPDLNFVINRMPLGTGGDRFGAYDY